MEPTELELAYLAGLFDGEGCFSMNFHLLERNGRPNIAYGIRMSVNLQYGHAVLDRFQSAFGGRSYVRTERGQRLWMLSRQHLVTRATTLLLPHLVIKRMIGARFLEAVQLMPASKGVKRTLGQRMWDADTARRFARIAYDLNPTQRLKRTWEEMDALIEHVYAT